MKKYLFLILAMLVSVSSLTLVSCSSDDDDEQNGNNNGKVTIAYEGAVTESYSIQEATFSLFSQDVEGTGHYDYESGATFDVAFIDGDGYNVYWQFQSRENIKAGQKLSINGIFFGDDTARSIDECSGNATVKSISGNKITIEFKNFSFDRYVSISSSSRQKVTISGTITFNLDE